MPQFDSSTFISQVFWLTVCLGFVTLFYVRYVLPRFNHLLEKRLHKLHYEREQVEHLNEELVLMQTAYQKRLEEEKSRAHALVKLKITELEIRQKEDIDNIKNNFQRTLKEIEKTMTSNFSVDNEHLDALIDECATGIIQRLSTPKDMESA